MCIIALTKEKNYQLVTKILQKHPDKINDLDEINENSSWHIAAQCNDVKMLAILFKFSTINIFKRNFFGRIPIETAKMNNADNAVKFLEPVNLFHLLLRRKKINSAMLNTLLKDMQNHDENTLQALNEPLELGGDKKLHPVIYLAQDAGNIDTFTELLSKWHYYLKLSNSQFKQANNTACQHAKLIMEKYSDKLLISNESDNRLEDALDKMEGMDSSKYSENNELVANYYSNQQISAENTICDNFSMPSIPIPTPYNLTQQQTTTHSIPIFYKQSPITTNQNITLPINYYSLYPGTSSSAKAEDLAEFTGSSAFAEDDGVSVSGQRDTDQSKMSIEPRGWRSNQKKRKRQGSQGSQGSQSSQSSQGSKGKQPLFSVFLNRGDNGSTIVFHPVHGVASGNRESVFQAGIFAQSPPHPSKRSRSSSPEYEEEENDNANQKLQNFSN